VSIPVTVPRDGDYHFQVIGGAPGTPGRHALFVDGGKAALVQYTADLALTTYQKWQYRGSAEVTVPLTAGQHTLSLRSSENGTSVLPNSDITLDKFVLTDVTDGEPTVYPASTLRYAGGAKVTYDTAKARGYGDISGSGQRADIYTQAWETGYYDLTVDYSTTGASAVDVRVNGRAVTQLGASREGGWRSTARVHLVQGINEIELSSPNGILLQQLTTTRAAAADGAAVTIEAEDTIRHGATSVNTFTTSSGTNASGLKGLGFIGNGAGNTFEVVRGPGFDQAGDYDIAVTYANAELGGAHAYNPQVIDRRLDVKETGGATSAGHAYFRYTYAWNSFLERTIAVTLSTAGGSLVFGNAGAYAPDVDKINIAPVTVGTPRTISTDTIAPTVSGSVSPAPVNGWVGTGAKLSITAADNESVESVEYAIGDGQLQTYTEPVPLPDGSYVITLRAMDASGNSATDVLPVKVDGTLPSLTWQSSIDPGTHYLFGSVPAEPTCSAADQTSGPNGCTVSGYSTAVGTHEVEAIARDVGGNTTVATLRYSVDPWTVKGFYQPVDLNGVVNIIKNGATVPLRFEVFAGATEVTSVSSVALSTSAVACDPQAPQDEIELTSSGPTPLRYEDGQFVSNWTTPKSAGTCYRVTATTADGSSIAALFRLR
jgi:hypothetical protein